MESVTKRILKEGSADTQDYVTWDKIEQMIGAQQMLQMIWNYLDVDQIRDLLHYLAHELSADGMEIEDSVDDSELDYEEDSDYPTF